MFRRILYATDRYLSARRRFKTIHPMPFNSAEISVTRIVRGFIPVGPVPICLFCATDWDDDDARGRDISVGDGANGIGIVKVDFRGAVLVSVIAEGIERSISGLVQSVLIYIVLFIPQEQG